MRNVTANTIPAHVSGPVALSRIRRRFLRSWLMPALLVALVCRAAIPAGFMPVATGDGLRIAPCPGMVQHDPAHQSTPDHSQTESSLCPFAASALPPLPAGQLVLVIEPASGVAPGVLCADSALAFTLERAQRARAPPVSRLIVS
jgi:hypothetical protein